MVPGAAAACVRIAAGSGPGPTSPVGMTKQRWSRVEGSTGPGGSGQRAADRRQAVGAVSLYHACCAARVD